MKNKDLAGEYAIKEYKRLVNNVYISENNLCFSIIDIKAAFNAGRESVVDSMPELEWREKICRDEYYLEAYALGAYYLIRLRGLEFHIACNYKHLKSCMSLSAAKQAAKEHHKELIKQALKI